MIKTDTLNITPEILGSIAEIDEFKGAWQALGMLAPERLNALRHIATIESIGASTRIEGSKLSDRDVEKLLDLQIKHFETRDEQEVAGYAKVIELVLRSWSDIHLTENHIKQLHGDLLRYSEKDARHRGEYKTAPNNVAAFDKSGKQIGVVFETATPFDTPASMGEVVAWANDTLATKKLHSILVIVIFIVVFLKIHPFQDGNGRLSRILTTLLLLRAGYAYVPYSSLESVIEKSREGYYRALRQTQKTIHTENPDWQPWLLYCLRILKKQTHNIATKIEREQITLSKLPMLSAQIMGYVRQHGRVTMAAMVAASGANRNTIKKHFNALVEKGRLVLRGKGRGSWYILR